MIKINIYLRLLALFVLSMSVINSAQACTCAPVSFCDYIDSEYFEEGVIWIGELIMSQELDNGFTANQFKVKEVLQGELRTGDSLWTSPAPFEWTYNNTDSTIWVFGGSSASCLEYFQDEDFLFATAFMGDDLAQDSPVPRGYLPSICLPDNLTIIDNNEVFDFIDSNRVMSNYTLDQIRDIIEFGCEKNESVATTDLDDTQSTIFNFYPNPTKGNLHIESFDYSFNDCNIEVYNVMGQSIKSQTTQWSEGLIDLQGTEDGVYFVTIECRGEVFVKRILKAS